jgi:hypothetical protein
LGAVGTVRRRELSTFGAEPEWERPVAKEGRSCGAGPVSIHDQDLNQACKHAENGDQGHDTPEVKTRRAGMVGGPNGVKGPAEIAPAEFPSGGSCSSHTSE